MEDNDFLKSYKNNLDEEDMFLEEPNQIEKTPSKPSDNSGEQKVNRRTTSPKGKATRANPSRHVGAPDDSMTYEEKNAFYAPDRYASSYAKVPQQSGGGGGYSIRNLVVIFVMIIILIGGIYAVVSFSNKVQVLDFTGWVKNDFMLWASEKKIMAQVEEIYDDDVESGKIISQLVPAGSKIKRNDFLKVYVSKGPDLTLEYYLPDIMNMSKQEIDTWAADNRMDKVRISAEYSDTIPKGQVITFEINDDTVIDKVKRSTPIYIKISKGSEVEYKPVKEIKVPDFKLLGLSGAMLFGQENGLVISVENEYNKYIPENTIISQSLSVDSIAHPGDTVVIIVSRGEMLVMPSLKRLDKNEAMSQAAQLGLPVKLKERYSSSDEGRMIYQSIPAGQQITDGMTLELTYSMGSQIAVSNFVGQQKFAIEEWMSGENEYGARLDLDVTYTQNTAPSGTILQQNIKDAYVYRDTVIEIVVSSGNVIFVPDFVAVKGAGYDKAVTREKAEEMAEGLGIILLFEEAENNERLPGEIWWQSRSAGSEVAVGTVITLRYNPVNKKLSVPDFSGKTVEQVKAMAQYEKLTVIFVLGEPDGVGNIVYDQSIAAYSTVAYGTKITLYVSVP